MGEESFPFSGGGGARDGGPVEMGEDFLVAPVIGQELIEAIALHFEESGESLPAGHLKDLGQGDLVQTFGVGIEEARRLAEEAEEAVVVMRVVVQEGALNLAITCDSTA